MQKKLLTLAVAGARTMLETVATLNLSFIVFTFGSLLVAIQVAGGQYTPRIIATTLLRDNAIRVTVGYFVFTLLAAVRLRARMSDEAVRQFETFVVGLLGLVSIVMFLYLIDYAARLLRPVSLAKRVGEYGIGVVRGVYPTSSPHKNAGQSSRKLGSPDRIVAHAGTSGIVLAVNLTGLVARARQSGGVIEFVPQVGDFVATTPACPCPTSPTSRTAAARGSKTATCARRSRSDPSGPWTRTRAFPSASWWIWRSRPCPRPSMTPRRPCSVSTSCTGCFAWSVSAMSAARSSATEPAKCGLSTGRRTGRISCTSRASRYASSAREASRSCGGCARCWKT